MKIYETRFHSKDVLHFPDPEYVELFSTENKAKEWLTCLAMSRCHIEWNFKWVGDYLISRVDGKDGDVVGQVIEREVHDDIEYFDDWTGGE